MRYSHLLVLLFALTSANSLLAAGGDHDEGGHDESGHEEGGHDESGHDEDGHGGGGHEEEEGAAELSEVQIRTAGIETLKILSEAGTYESLEERSRRLTQGMAEAFARAGVPAYQTRVGAMFCTFFTTEKVTDFTTASRCDTAAFGRYFHAMLRHGVYLAPSQFEAAFLSLAHGNAEIDRTVEACEKALREL